MKIGYQRISTEEQTHALQESALNEFGCDTIFSDTISGKTTSRSGLDSALSALNAGDTLVVWKLDRLGRKASYLFDLVTDLKERDINFVSITENFDTSTTMGWAMFQMMGVFAELERNTISDRVTAGMAAAKANGVKLGPKGIDEKLRKLILSHRKDNKTCREVAELTGVSTATVSRVTRGIGCH